MTTMQERLTVGHRLMTREEIEAVPIGGVIGGSSSGQHYTRVDGGYTINGRTDGRIKPLTDFAVDYNLIISLPESSDSELPAAGEVLTGDNVNTLPIGSTVRNALSSRTWTREPELWRSDAAGGTITLARMARRTGGGHVSFLEGPVPTTTTTPPPEVDTTEQTPMGPPVTLEQFKQRFATLMWGAQQHSGVGRESMIENALHTDLAIPKYGAMVGLSVCYTDIALLSRLPIGTILVTEAEPGDPNYSVYKANGSRGRDLLLGTGVGAGPAMVLTVESVPGSEAAAPWVNSSESELDAIHTFRAKAWSTAMHVKSSTGWCNELEQAVYRSGIDNTSGRADSERVTAEQAAELPVGTILRYMSSRVLFENARHRSVQTALYVRDDAAENPAKTRRIGGSLPGSWTPTEMKVVHRPGSNMSIKCCSFVEMDSLPVGTRVGDGYTSYEKGEPNDAGSNWFNTTSPSSVYPSSSLGLSLTYRVIPV